jgi:hypothetical protein
MAHLYPKKWASDWCNEQIWGGNGRGEQRVISNERKMCCGYTHDGIFVDVVADAK